MSLKLAASLSIVCGGAPASAERVIQIELSDPAPFAATELVDAMRMRLPADGAPVHVRVTRTGDGVRIEAAPGSREVALHGIAGPAAARLVALAASDLLLDDLAAAPELVVRAPAREAPASRSLGVYGSVASWDGVLGGGSIDLAVPAAGYLATFELGGGGLVGGQVRLWAGVARIDGGVRAGVFELRAGATLAPIVAQTGAGDATVLAGGNASARVRLPVTRGSRAVLSAGADVFATRTQYLLDGAKVLTTPRFAPWFSAGMEVSL